MRNTWGTHTILGWDLDEHLQGIHIPLDNDAAFSSAVESASRRLTLMDEGRLARLGYLAKPRRRAGYGLRAFAADRMAA